MEEELVEIHDKASVDKVDRQRQAHWKVLGISRSSLRLDIGILHLPLKLDRLVRREREITSVEDMIDQTEADLLDIDGLGPVFLQDIITALAAKRLSLYPGNVLRSRRQQYRNQPS